MLRRTTGLILCASSWACSQPPPASTPAPAARHETPRFCQRGEEFFGGSCASRDPAKYANRPKPPAWISLLQTPSFDHASAVATDARGNVFVAGTTAGTLPEIAVGPSFERNHGGYDAFVAKYWSDGSLQWARGVGTGGNDGILGAAADNEGDVIVAGHSWGEKVLVAKFGADGALAWMQEHVVLGAGSAAAVAVDPLGNVYLAGQSVPLPCAHRPGGTEALFAKLDSSGALRWSKYLGSNRDDGARAISLDDHGNVYVTGFTDGAFEGHPAVGNRGVFVAAFDNDGNDLWSNVYPHDGDETGVGIVADVNGYIDVAVAGRTSAFVAQFDLAGRQRWSQPLGFTGEAFALAQDFSGDLYVTGHATEGSGVFIARISNSGEAETNWSIPGLPDDSKSAGSAAGEAITVTPDAQIFVAGTVPPGVIDDHPARAGFTDAFLLHRCATLDLSCPKE